MTLRSLVPQKFVGYRDDKGVKHLKVHSHLFNNFVKMSPVVLKIVGAGAEIRTDEIK
jgi:hypothetical protein